MFTPRTASKVFSAEYRQLRAVGMIDRTRLTEQERRFADIRKSDGLGADDHEFSTSEFQTPYDPEHNITSDSKCDEVLKGASNQ